MNKKIEQVHFQITKNCNLRCPFCGQWGERGFFSAANGTPLSYDEWISAAMQLKKIEPLPTVTVWGGEPLSYSFFDKLSNRLFDMGFRLRAVTNGTMIDRHTETLKRCYEQVYVSIDGLAELHNSIRGKGVFEKVTENLKLLDKNRVVIMTVATEKLDAVRFAEFFKDYRILLQTMIAFDSEEIDEYKRWFRGVFNREATEINSWFGNGFRGDYKNLPENVTVMPHGDMARGGVCNSPFSHIHITWNGNVTFCTDFYDFSAGNVREKSIEEIFNSEAAEKFRAEVLGGRCVSCRHCSWKNNERI